MLFFLLFLSLFLFFLHFIHFLLYLHLKILLVLLFQLIYTNSLYFTLILTLLVLHIIYSLLFIVLICYQSLLNLLQGEESAEHIEYSFDIFIFHLALYNTMLKTPNTRCSYNFCLASSSVSLVWVVLQWIHLHPRSHYSILHRSNSLGWFLSKLYVLTLCNPY